MVTPGIFFLCLLLLCPPRNRLNWKLSKFSQEWYQIRSVLSTPDPFWLPLNAKTGKGPAVKEKKKHENLIACYPCTVKVAKGEWCFNGYITDYAEREVTDGFLFVSDCI